MEFRIEEMTCSGCVRGVTRSVRSVDPDARVEADLDTRKVHVESVASRETIVAALEAAGFPAA